MSLANKKKIQRAEPPLVRKQAGQLNVRALSEREQRSLHWAELVFASGLVGFFCFPVFSLVSIGMHFQINAWHGLSLLLPAVLLTVGVHWRKRFPAPLILRYGSKGLHLNEGETWAWGRVVVRCSMQGSGLRGHTLEVCKADEAILWLQVDGLEPIRLVAAPCKSARSLRGKYSSPVKRFRYELGSLLGWLPDEAIRLTVSPGDWAQGRIFWPMSIDPDALIYLLLTAAVCALLWYLGEPGAQSTAVCGVIGWLCLVVALLMWHSLLDKVVVSRKGVLSRRHGLVKWDEIQQLEMPTRWVRSSTHHDDTPPPGMRAGFSAVRPIVILSRPGSQPIVWQWMDWPAGWRSSTEFRALCEEGRLRFLAMPDAAVNNT